MSKLVEEQPAPTQNQEPAMWDLVIADLKLIFSSIVPPEDVLIINLMVNDAGERDQVGFKRYGTRLQPFNGRNAVIDAWQEQLDGLVYTRQKLQEQLDPELMEIYKEMVFLMIKYRKHMHARYAL